MKLKLLLLQEANGDRSKEVQDMQKENCWLQTLKRITTKESDIVKPLMESESLIQKNW
jgi:hypothetical protein